MRIAVDVKGTLEGRRKQDILAMIQVFRDAGHEVVIWSNSFSFAVNTVANNKLDLEPMSKRTKWDCEDNPELYMDIAIDDDSSQTYLAARRFVWVHEIPEDAIGFAKTLIGVQNGNNGA